MAPRWRFGLVWALWAFVGNGAALAGGIHATLTDAQKHFEGTHYDQALKLYQQANDAEPGHAAIEYNMALCHLHLGDGEKAAQQFEGVASRAEVNRSLRRDAFYNVGLIRAWAARERLRDLLAPATQPSDHKPAPDDPANIPKLQAVADDLLRAIAAFRKSAEVEPSQDAEHNIRAARITRRDVLGMLRKAAEAKQKEDILKDPRAYLQALILEQEQQVSLGRLLILNPPKDAAQAREARRAGVRAQRKIMENTGTLADNLSQFREAAATDQPGGPTAGHPGSPASAPATQPEETPREKIYKAAAKQIGKAVEAQRDACAFLLDGETKPAHEKQTAARDEMRAGLYMFPLEPGQVLVKSRLEQAELRETVAGIKGPEGWLRDPLLPEAAIPLVVDEEPARTPIHYGQTQVGLALGILRRQCEQVAATSPPADEGGQDGQGPRTPPKPPLAKGGKSGNPPLAKGGRADDSSEQKEPMLDPELNRKLADALKNADDLQKKCIDAIAARNQKATMAGQDEMLKLIDAALELLPKTIEQRITELILRQARLNAEVQGEAGRPSEKSNRATAALDEIRNLATRFKSKLMGMKPGKLAEALNNKQKGIRADTGAVNDEVRKKVPASADAQANAGSPPASQPAELKAYIESSKHLVEAGNHMDTSLKGFEQSIVEDSLRPMQPGGPVQTGQGKALEELVKALAALKPPTTQPNQDKDDQKQQKQDQQEQQKDEDKQREVERLDKERERAERELYQRRPRTVIKDW